MLVSSKEESFFKHKNFLNLVTYTYHDKVHFEFSAIFPQDENPHQTQSEVIKPTAKMNPGIKVEMAVN